MSTNLEDGVRIGDFQIVKRIGAGGMGIVYLARQVSLNRLVALKVLGSALTDPSDIARFQREAQAIAKLNHPGIASVYYVGQDHQVCHIAMEYIDGASLREVLKRLSTMSQFDQSPDAVLRAIPSGEAEAPEIRFDQETVTYLPGPAAGGTRVGPGSLTPQATQVMTSPAYIRRCSEIVRDAALALAHAHERGVVHRDIKPENLLLDRQGKVHLIDFGIARFFEDITLTNTGALVGTPMYMSPEQVTGRIKVDHRTDIYSLGLVLYELLTLRRPIVGATRDAVLLQAVTKALLPVGRRNPSVSADLESVVHKATAKDPDLRYESAAGLATDLQDHLHGKPVSAPPYRFRLDERQIVAERPGLVAFAGYLVAVIASAQATLQLLFLYETVPAYRQGETPWPTFLIQAAGLLLIPASYLTGLSILKGQRYFVGVSMLLLLMLLGTTSCLMILETFPGLKPLPVLITTFCPPTLVLLVGLLVLLPQGSKKWFSLAERLRSEHKQQAPP